MKSSGYTLDLYCDRASEHHTYKEFPHEYLDPESGASCRNQARKAGWYMSDALDLCPKCNPKSKHYIPSKIHGETK